MGGPYRTATMQVNATADRPDGETRALLKRVARRLFAERGIRAVTVREIAREAGQRNQGAVAYHFGTKEALIAELLIDGAERIEQRREAMLQTLEAAGGPIDVREAVAAIVLPSAAFADEDREHGASFNRFLLRLTNYDPGYVDRTLAGRYNGAYQRCLQHLRRLMSGMPRRVQGQRFVFLGAYISSVLAHREMMLGEAGEGHPHWRTPKMLDDLVETAAALLTAPVP